MFSIHDEVALKSFLESIGEKKFRVEQIYRAIYKDSVDSFQKITTIPKTLQELLEKEAIFSSLSIVRRLDSDDKQTTKLLLATSDGHHIESVIMRHLSGRTTVCISSQVGCPMGCVFCATGKLGLKRNLAFYEILDQILVAIRILMPEGRKLRNVVCMGMGEPFLNYEQLKSALSIVCNQKKMDFSPRRVTVSTCGIIPGIERFRDDFPQASLAISLHAPSNEIRSTIMPVCKPYPLEDLMNTLDAYVAKTNKKIFYEYIMIQGVTDLPICGKLLAKLLR
jgi:23S rRNA (adenine2503-C2)-methyltransferase